MTSDARVWRLLPRPVLWGAPLVGAAWLGLALLEVATNGATVIFAGNLVLGVLASVVGIVNLRRSVVATPAGSGGGGLPSAHRPTTCRGSR